MDNRLRRFIPDLRARVDVELVGSPLTHERFLRRHRGTYGPELSAADSAFPGAYGKQTREIFINQQEIFLLRPWTDS